MIEVQQTISNRVALNSAYEQRAQDKAEREQGTQELEHYKRILARKQEALERAVAAENETSIDIADAAGLAQKRRDAEAEASAAERAQRAAQTKYSELCRAADAAEGAVAQAVDAILRAEKMQLAAQISSHMREVRALVAKLREHIPSELHTPVNMRLEIEPEVAVALASVPPRDD